MRRIRIRSRSATVAVLAALLVVGLVPGAVAAATRPVTYDVYIGDSCVSGHASDESTVELVWRAANGTRKARASLEASGFGGYWLYCSNDGDIVTIGDSFFAHDGNSSHSLVVPRLTLVIDRVDDVFKGRGPAGEYVKLICGYTNGFEPCTASWRIRTNANGKWSYKPGWRVDGWQWMYLLWKSQDGDKVNVSTQGPYLDVTIGSPIVRGASRANGPVTVVLRRAGSGEVAGTAVTTAGPMGGKFVAKFRNNNGNLVKVRVGDHITSDVAPDADWDVPDIVAHADQSSDLVTGTCPADSFFVEARVMRHGYAEGDYTWPEEDGSFELDLSQEDIRPHELVRVKCYIVGPGDWVGRRVEAN